MNLEVRSEFSLDAHDDFPQLSAQAREAVFDGFGSGAKFNCDFLCGIAFTVLAAEQFRICDWQFVEGFPCKCSGMMGGRIPTII